MLSRVVELTNPVLKGNDLTYDIKVLGGEVPKSAEAPSLSSTGGTGLAGVRDIAGVRRRPLPVAAAGAAIGAICTAVSCSDHCSVVRGIIRGRRLRLRASTSRI